VEPLNRVYREGGVYLPETQYAGDFKKTDPALRSALILAPPSAGGSTWMRRFGDYSDAFASGWMRLRGSRRRRGVDRGFILSDHADWPGLLWAIEQTGAERVMVTHGSVNVLVRYLREQRGLDAQGFVTEYGDEDEGDGAASEAPQGEAHADGSVRAHDPVEAAEDLHAASAEQAHADTLAPPVRAS
jgi:putative mRNA 3-end processing factor